MPPENKNTLKKANRNHTNMAYHEQISASEELPVWSVTSDIKFTRKNKSSFDRLCP